MDFEKARFLMIEQQIRTWEVLDPSVLDLLFALKREDFVPAAYRSLAFVDMEIPLGDDQAMMAPKLEARIVQEVAPKAGDAVLEIGTGSGYLAALLAKQAAHVTSIEYFEDLSRAAAANLAQAAISNVQLKIGDAANDLAGLIGAGARFDVIVLSASVPLLPPVFLDYLKVGGRLFAVIGDAPAMKATIITKTDEISFVSNEIFETVLAPLVNATQPSRFAF
ncbi:MAG TPA: protein-L-isoaspartate O-methyltransferase [Usitatibacteraceae bacterium]